jgi:NADPH:quinone reductase-like Zn-dependent oxidoreductase
MDTPVRPQSAPLQGTESAANAVARVNYTHDAMIDLIIANPAITQNELARHFGYSVPWLSRIRNSDAFLARLAERKKDIVDPGVIASVEEKLRNIVDKSAEIILNKLETTQSADLAFKALELGGKLAGYGARQTGPVVNNNFVVALPPKAQSEQGWAAAHDPNVIDMPPKAA